MDIIDKRFVGFAAQVATESPSVMNRINPKLVPNDVSDAVRSKLEFWRDPYMNLLDRCSLKGQVLKRLMTIRFCFLEGHVLPRNV
jgi:hypothetical protein